MDQTLGISMTKYTIPNILSVYAWIYISDITANTLTLYVNLKQANGTSFVVTEKKKDSRTKNEKNFEFSTDPKVLCKGCSVLGTEYV